MWTITVSWELDQNIPAPIPSGFRWTGSATFLIHSDAQPKFRDIKAKAIAEHGAGSKGFRIVGISWLEENFFSTPGDTTPEIPETEEI